MHGRRGLRRCRAAAERGEPVAVQRGQRLGQMPSARADRPPSAPRASLRQFQRLGRKGGLRSAPARRAAHAAASSSRLAGEMTVSIGSLLRPAAQARRAATARKAAPKRSIFCGAHALTRSSSARVEGRASAILRSVEWVQDSGLPVPSSPRCKLQLHLGQPVEDRARHRARPASSAPGAAAPSAAPVITSRNAAP